MNGEEGEEREEHDSGPFCRHWGDPADCDDCKEVKAAVETIRHELADMPPVQRLELLEEILEGYCRECGEVRPVGKICHCQNDE